MKTVDTYLALFIDLAFKTHNVTCL